MANDYEKAIGVWSHKIGNVEHKIVPKEGDNLAIARVMKQASKNGIDWLYDQFNGLYFAMVSRESENNVTDANKGKLKLWVEKNQVQIQKDMLVEFGWQTKEQQEKLENLDTDQIKKLASL